MTAGTDGVARLWDAATGELKAGYFGATQYLMDAALAPDGSMVVTGGGDGVLRFWDVATSRLIWMLPAHHTQIVGIRFDEDDIVTRGFTGGLARWRLPKLPDFAKTVEGIARCIPLRLDDASGRLVEQEPVCDR